MDNTDKKQKPGLTIFLDIDGVVVTEWSYLNVEGELNADSVFALNQLFEQFETRIVVSSTWREMHSQEELKEILKPLKAEIIGVTPVLETRGEEIFQWIHDNELSTAFLILDDNLFDLEHFFSANHIVYIENGYKTTAFTADHITDAIEKTLLQIHE